MEKEMDNEMENVVYIVFYEIISVSCLFFVRPEPAPGGSAAEDLPWVPLHHIPI